MKKFSLVLLAIATALAISTVASAQPNYDFTFSGSGITASGSLYSITPYGNGGGYLATSGGLTLNGNLADPFSLIPNPNNGAPAGYPGFIYDDLIFPTCAACKAGNLLDIDGILFTDNSNNVINIWGTGSNTGYILYLGQSYSGTFTLTPPMPCPDGGTTLTLLGLAIAGLAGLRRKLGV
jgi:hypothetical protein